MMKNPFANMTTIYTPQELLDIAFKRASKIDIKFRPKTPNIIKAKKRELLRITKVTDDLIERMTKMIKTFPTFDNLHPFYYDLTKTMVDIDKFKKNIASLSGTLNILKKIHQEHFYRIKKTDNPTIAGAERTAFYGRISSVINRLSDRLDYLRDQRNIFRKLPAISPRFFTIVVAGYPNVGKSSLVRSISTADPEIASYPFTTRNIIVGHRILNEHDPIPTRIQIIDTPGLLDRPLSQRNNIELQAIVALKHLANVIVFMIDPSETCGYPIPNQMRLLQEIREIFPTIPFLLNLNKMDIAHLNQVTQVQAAIKEIFQDSTPKILETIAVNEVGVTEVFNAAMTYWVADSEEGSPSF